MKQQGVGTEENVFYFRPGRHSLKFNTALGMWVPTRNSCQASA